MSLLAMPKILFRAMKSASDGKPLCGLLANELGVRPRLDIPISADSFVHPQTGGLSTTPDDPALLPPHVRPPSLGGKGKLPLFTFDVTLLDSSLTSRRDPKNPTKHAFIEPDSTMALSTFQERLCGSRQAWQGVAK